MAMMSFMASKWNEACFVSMREEMTTYHSLLPLPSLQQFGLVLLLCLAGAINPQGPGLAGTNTTGRHNRTLLSARDRNLN